MQAVNEFVVRQEPVFKIEDALEFKPINYYIAPQKRGVRRHFGFHPFFTTRPYNVVKEYINCFTKPGDLVLDGFAGAGVTPIEALVLKRKAIALDINPIACFITECKAISPVDITLLLTEFEKIKEKIASKVLKLDEMEEDDVLKELENHWYPKDPIPQTVDQNGVLTIDKLFTPRQLLGLALIKEYIEKVENKTIKKLLLLTFSASITKANKTYVSPKGRSGILRGQARFLQHFKFSIPKSMYEVNPWKSFESRFENVLRAKKETNMVLGDYVTNNTFSVHQLSAREVHKVISKEKVDYIFTDPPYGSSIAYLDLSLIWASWLGFRYTDYEKSEEIIEGGSLNKTREDYLFLLEEAIINMAATLKKDCYFSLVYANKDPKIWGALMDYAKEAGLTLENVIPQPNYVLPSVTKIKNPFTTLSGELILNFRKRKAQKTITKEISFIPNLTKFFIAEASRIIIRHLGATTDEICFSVISKLLSGGLLDKAQNLDHMFGEKQSMIEFLERTFKKENGCWHLKVLEKPDNIHNDEWIRYLIFTFLTSNGKEATLEEIINFILTHTKDVKKDIDPLDILKEIAVRGKRGWKINPNLLVQLTLPLGKVPEREKPRKKERDKYIQAYNEDPLFKIKPLPLREIDHNILPDGE